MGFDRCVRVIDSLSSRLDRSVIGRIGALDRRSTPGRAGRGWIENASEDRHLCTRWRGRSGVVSSRAFALTTVALGLVALLHAALTWPPAATLAFFGGGALVALVAEAVVIKLDWLEHRIGPKVSDVPVYVLFGWTGVVYVAFRLSLLVTDGWAAVVVAAVLATTYDALTDHRGVSDGHWTYTDDLPGPRPRGVPWWNFAGWLLVSLVTAAFALPYL